jgi:excisionase family DNA binding protein
MNNGSNLNKLISVEDLMEIFKISKSSVYRLVDNRKIPFYKIGGSLRFKEDDIVIYLESSRFEQIIR